MPEIVVRETPDTFWDFHTGRLMLRYAGERGYESELDPFPCYQHDADLVRAVLDRCSTVVPLSVPLIVHLPAHEGVERTNGWTTYRALDDGESIETHIVLSGKRIPPHPAVTEYVVAHEYGHAVAYDLMRRRDEWTLESLEDEYCRMRDIAPDPIYGGGRWHRHPGEVMACDFRIMMTGTQSEYWPHHGVDHPFKSGARIHDWWTERLASVAVAVTADA